MTTKANKSGLRVSRIRVHRNPILFGFDVAAWVVALVLVPMVLGFGSVDTGWPADLLVGFVAIAVVVVVGHQREIYATFTIGSSDEILAAAVADLAGGVALALALRVLDYPDVAVHSLSVALTAFSVQVLGRVSWRSYRNRAGFPNLAGHEPMVIFGAGFGGTHIAEALSTEIGKFRVVAMLDDDSRVHGRKIAGVEVEGGREMLPELTQRFGLKHLLIAIPSADSRLIRELTELGRSLGLRVSVLPSLAEIMAGGGAVTVSGIRDVSPLDLLGRKPVDLDLATRGAYVQGRVVLVTGAGGSIGSELCRQLSRLGPRHLLMLDRDESALHSLQLSMDGRALLDDDSLIVADIRDSERMAEIFERWRPDVVFHTAALKHLTLLEAAPVEAFKTNVLGSFNLLDMAVTHGVGHFINVSTDKAADPTSVLGYSKRLAERLTANAAAAGNEGFLSVRFGNVLGSRGSVLTAFAKQIEMGRNLTVTDPEIERYFMTVEEAVGLVIAAGDIGRGGEVMILEMGDPVRIIDVARQMIEFSGKDLDVEITGLRPGEKMSERLTGIDEPSVLDESGLMWHGSCPPLAWSEVEDLMFVSDGESMRDALGRKCSLPASPPGTLVDQSDETSVTTFLSPPDMTALERRALLDAFDSGWIAPAGPSIFEFEQALAGYVGVPAAVVLSNGTAALHLALHLRGIGAGDEVVVQSATFAATAFAVQMTGATPVFCDSDERTGNLDPVLLAEFLEARCRVGRLPAAVVTVDLYGFCADYLAIRPICDQYGVDLIQDAAEALGSISQHRHAGSQGDLAVLSFNGNKIITTGGGGALLGDVPTIERARKLATQAREPARHYEHLERGFNYRMSNLAAALGVAQLSRLETIIERRLQIQGFYRSQIEECQWFPTGVTERPNHWLNVALLPDGIEPGEVCDALQRHGIEARPAWKPMHRQPVFADAEVIGGRHAERLFGRGVCLPSGATLSDATVEHIVEVVNETIKSQSSSVTR